MVHTAAQCRDIVNNAATAQCGPGGNTYVGQESITTDPHGWEPRTFTDCGRGMVGTGCGRTAQSVLGPPKTAVVRRGAVLRAAFCANVRAALLDKCGGLQVAAVFRTVTLPRSPLPQPFNVPQMIALLPQRRDVRRERVVQHEPGGRPVRREPPLHL
eukprot:gene20622-biopygen16131